MSDQTRIAFNSAYRYEQVALTTSATFSLSGAFASTTKAIPHNFGYKPYVKAWYTYNSGKYYQLFAGVGSYNIAGNGYQVEDAHMTTTDFIVKIAEENGAATSASGVIYCRFYSEEQI